MTYQDYINRTEQYKKEISMLERDLQALDSELKEYNEQKETEKDDYGSDIDRLINFKRMSKWSITMTIIALAASVVSLGLNLFQGEVLAFLEQKLTIFLTSSFLSSVALGSTVIAVASFLTVPIFGVIAHLSKKDNHLKGTKGRQMVDHIGEMQQEIDRTNAAKEKEKAKIKKQLDEKRNEYQILSNAYRVMFEKAVQKLHATMDIPDVETLAREDSFKTEVVPNQAVPNQFNPTPRSTPKVRVKLYPSK